MVGPFTICLGLDLATLTGSHIHCDTDSDTRCSPISQDPALTSHGQGHPLATRSQHTGSPGYSDLCSPELPAGKGFLLPHAVSIFLDNYPQAKDNKELYLELGDRALKFSARCMVNEPTNHPSSAIHELHSCIPMMFFLPKNVYLQLYMTDLLNSVVAMH